MMHWKPCTGAWRYLGEDRGLLQEGGHVAFSCWGAKQSLELLLTQRRRGQVPQPEDRRLTFLLANVSSVWFTVKLANSQHVLAAASFRQTLCSPPDGPARRISTGV